MDNQHYYYKKQEVIEQAKYIIKDETMGIKPVYANNGALHSQVLCQYDIKLVTIRPYQIVKDSSIYYGCDLEGINNSAKEILKDQRMLPAVISQVNQFCMIPLSSAKSDDCIWISFHHVIDIIADKNDSIIVFTNHNKLRVPISRGTLQDKLNKSARLITTYSQRQSHIADLYRMSGVAESREGYFY
ncbi:hypothetical protein FS935_21260 [Metabacillus litoralis]|uniref:Competence protein n=1 Tax=Metabacillus litoralis TaxID=152268 RepID=A0A5C6VC97_9BACI|nr:competence protein ComK [Metabacillus litoralis]TXC82226.1 hypothetical protein FS935_21260 [Metabacillus litoralis]